MIYGLFEAESSCPLNEREVECINFCNTCGLDSACPDICVRGCDCNPGFLRNILGKCVPRHLCKPPQGEQSLRCPSNEHFAPCSAHCQRNCGNLNKSVACPFVCVPGCVCDSGFVRGPNTKCIKKENCHGSENKISIATNADCPADEEMSECHAHCQRNCSNYKDTVLLCSKSASPVVSVEKGWSEDPKTTAFLRKNVHSKDLRKRVYPTLNKWDVHLKNISTPVERTVRKTAPIG
ncbi:Serine protease inhibitor swm-1 like protein [Argiope bruennichi]|uniref:Serine protease inhibitor swm-1 like protein n=1 Tax=Argiope bruennichi TaxID=94029 RepID=A0A8T0EHM8_ARGBR|nr:Serine protease inhibitor swm-1 like protein [Argiope bruennichi]